MMTNVGNVNVIDVDGAAAPSPAPTRPALHRTPVPA